jgi:uncharacterized protein (TIGR02001 family)
VPRVPMLLRAPRTGMACVALSMLPPGVMAQVGASIAFDSDYRFRGVSLSDSRPSLQASVDFDAASGWYAGTSAAQSEPTTGARYAQWLVYSGYVVPAGAGRSVEVGASYSHFSGNTGLDFAEGYLGVLFENWSLRLHLAPDYFGQNVRTAYLDASAQLSLNEHASLFGHVGLLDPIAARASASDEANQSRADLRVGLGWVSGGIDLQLAWVTVSPGGPFPAAYGKARSTWVFGASYSF